MQNEWDNLPFSSQLRMPITASVPMIFRWKIMQMKLLLNDIRYMRDTLGISGATLLYDIVEREAIDLCVQLYKEIEEQRKNRSEY